MSVAFQLIEQKAVVDTARLVNVMVTPHKVYITDTPMMILLIQAYPHPDVT